MAIEKKKRKRLFVDRKVQGALARRLVAHWCIFFGIVICLQFIMTWMVDPMMSFEQLTQRVIQNSSLLVIAILLLFPSFVYDTIKISNRFAGPMVRLRKEMEAVAESGELNDVKFRDGDFWIEMADSYNRMIKTLQSQTLQPPTQDKVGKQGQESASTEAETNEIADGELQSANSI